MTNKLQEIITQYVGPCFSKRGKLAGDSCIQGLSHLALGTAASSEKLLEEGPYK